jgi:hypothetical protein
MPNDELKLAGRDFTVTNLEEALCIAGEGELPFAFGAGYPAQLVDLRTTGEGKAAFASIDYSETPPLVFVGESLPFAASISPTCAAKPRPKSRPARSRRCNVRPAAVPSASTTRRCKASPVRPASACSNPPTKACASCKRPRPRRASNR